jgi:hypothetical protein
MGPGFRRDDGRGEPAGTYKTQIKEGSFGFMRKCPNFDTT